MRKTCFWNRIRVSVPSACLLFSRLFLISSSFHQQQRMAKASGFHKKASKRVTIRKKHMVMKKVKEHKKKVKKMAKKNGPKHHKKERPLQMPRKAPFDLQWDGDVAPSRKKVKNEVKNPSADV